MKYFKIYVIINMLGLTNLFDAFNNHSFCAGGILKAAFKNKKGESMIKKQMLAVAFAVFALNSAYSQPFANNKDMGDTYKNTQKTLTDIQNNNAGSFFLQNMLASSNLDKKLNNAYLASVKKATPSQACNSVNEQDIDKVLISKIKTFSLTEEYKKVKPDTKIERIDYSKVRPHLHKRKILAAVRSEIRADNEVSAKQDILKQVHFNFRLIAGQAALSSDIVYKRSLLCIVEKALNSIKQANYIYALEITKQAVNK